MEVLLVPASDETLADFAAVVARRPVDPQGLTDHRWLLGSASEVAERLRLARDWRVDPGGEAWVVLANDIPVGFISAAVEGDSAETFSVIATDVQGRGFGTAARRAALGRLAERGVSRVISASRPGSASAHISRRLGYVLAGSEIRQSMDGIEVELERWELALTDFSDSGN